jgi:RES domain-containing protein
VYLAETVASALLERLVHLMDDAQIPIGLHLIRVDYPDTLACSEITEANLPPDWRDNAATSRFSGDLWLQQGRSALVSVPSAVIPHSRNFLLNPDHPDSALVKIEKTLSFELEPRLKRLADYALSYRRDVRYVVPDE